MLTALGDINDHLEGVRWDNDPRSGGLVYGLSLE